MENSLPEDSHSLYPLPPRASASLEPPNSCQSATPAASTQASLREQFASTQLGTGRSSKAATWHRRSLDAFKVFVGQIVDLVCGERISILLVVVPVGIAVGLWASADPILVFILNALAIIPLAVIISTATESLASRLGDTLGALLNVTVGNAAELIIFFTALAKDQIRIVQSSLLGSILANSLLVLGTANICGGLRFGSQLYDKASGRLSVCLLNVGILVSMLPVGIFVVTHRNHSNQTTLDISRGISIGLVVVYLFYLLLQMVLQISSTSTTRPDHASGNGYLTLHQNSPIERMKHPVAHNRSISLQFRSPRRFRSLSLALPGLHQGKPGFRSRISNLFSTPSNPYDHYYRLENLSENDQDYDVTGGRDLEATLQTRHDDTHDHTRENVVASTTDTSMEDQRNEQRPRSAERFSPLPLSPPSTPDLTESPISIPMGLRGATSTPKRFDFQSSWDPEHSGWPDTPPLDETGGRKSPSESDESVMSQTSLPVAVAVLLLATAIAAVTTELAVDAIPALVDSWNISHIFLGFIVLPFVGNAAEHVTAAKMALRNRMVLAKNVAVESATQVVLFITPSIVLLGWLRDRKMSLQFDHFEIGCILVTGLIVSIAICRGDSGWKQGLCLHGVYLAFAIGAVFYRGRSWQD